MAARSASLPPPIGAATPALAQRPVPRRETAGVPDLMAVLKRAADGETTRRADGPRALKTHVRSASDAQAPAPIARTIVTTSNSTITTTILRLAAAPSRLFAPLRPREAGLAALTELSVEPRIGPYVMVGTLRRQHHAASVRSGCRVRCQPLTTATATTTADTAAAHIRSKVRRCTAAEPRGARTRGLNVRLTCMSIATSTLSVRSYTHTGAPGTPPETRKGRADSWPGKASRTQCRLPRRRQAGATLPRGSRR
jgi:hypothetical protein